MGFDFIVNVPGPPLLAKLAKNFLVGKYCAVGFHHVAGDGVWDLDIISAEAITWKETIDDFHGSLSECGLVWGSRIRTNLHAEYF